MTESPTSSFSQRIAGWFRKGFQPASIGTVEWLLMRLAFAALVLWTLNDWHPFAFAAQPSPVGLARWIDLTWLHHDGMFPWVFGISALLCALYVVGLGLPLVLPALTAVHVIVRTYNNSQGFTHHGVQLVSMVLLVQTLTVWWKCRTSRAEQAAWLWYYSRGIVLFSYVASAITKLINTKGLWVWQSRYLPIEIVKSWRLEYLTRLDPEFAGDPSAAFWLAHHPFAAQIIFGAGFFLELFAFLGLRDRLWSAIIGVAIVTMHLSIEWLMQLTFMNHQWLCLIFLINPIGWLLMLLGARHGRMLPQPPNR